VLDVHGLSEVDGAVELGDGPRGLGRLVEQHEPKALTAT
jgi:hypothetical protein